MVNDTETRATLAAFARDFDWAETLEETDPAFAVDEIISQLSQGGDRIAGILEDEEWANFLRGELLASLEKRSKE